MLCTGRSSKKRLFPGEQPLLLFVARAGFLFISGHLGYVSLESLINSGSAHAAANTHGDNSVTALDLLEVGKAGGS